MYAEWLVHRTINCGNKQALDLLHEKKNKYLVYSRIMARQTNYLYHDLKDISTEKMESVLLLNGISF